MRTYWHRRAAITIGTVTTLPAGSDATATITENQVLSLGIPKGPQGDTGATGATPAFTIGTVKTIDPDTGTEVSSIVGKATASISGTAAAPVLNLGIPMGFTGTSENVTANTVPMSSTDATTVAQKFAQVAAAAETVTRYSATFYASNWQQEAAEEGEDENPYTQTVVPTGFSYSAAIRDTAADIDMSEATTATAAALLAAWSAIGRLYVDANGLNAVCYGDPPETDVKVVLSVWKSGS